MKSKIKSILNKLFFVNEGKVVPNFHSTSEMNLSLINHGKLENFVVIKNTKNGELTLGQLIFAIGFGKEARVTYFSLLTKELIKIDDTAGCIFYTVSRTRSDGKLLPQYQGDDDNFSLSVYNKAYRYCKKKDIDFAPDNEPFRNKKFSLQVSKVIAGCVYWQKAYEKDMLCDDHDDY